MHARFAVGMLIAAVALAGGVTLSCGDDDAPSAPPPSQLAPTETLLDSKFCSGCHPDQYEEWSGSMHAYATDDPVFRALNAKMQSEVPPEKKTFCLSCHAPMAVRLGKSTDPAALDATPELKGVTCFFCHAAKSSHGVNNNPLDLADPPVMGAAIRDPVDPAVHLAEYRMFLDGKSDIQAGMCGPCHDIEALAGAHVERTFQEWRTSRFGGGERTKTSCASCHMPERQGLASVRANSPVRAIHDHAMPGVDLALSAFTGKDVQRQKAQTFLDDAIDARLCVTPNGAGSTVDVTLFNRRVGHGFPSGANQDRRSWIDLTAFAGTDVVLRTGDIPDDRAVATVQDPSLFLLRDHDLDAQGNEVELFWRTASFTSKQLPAATTDNPANPAYDNGVHATYALDRAPDRITMVLRIRPIDFDFLDAAEALGLARSALDPVPTFALAKTRLEWTAADGKPCVGVD